MSDALIALAGRTLGALLYYPPLSAPNAGLLNALAAPGWEHEWPEMAGTRAAAALIRQGLASPWHESLEDTFQNLFIGPYALPAPPWGSVYLDREGVLFGESTVALRRWLAREGITTRQRDGEPEDHIGLLLMLAAWLAENNAGQLDALLEQHLLPWSGRYLTLLEQGTDHPFYRGVARLASLTLDRWRQQRGLQLPARELFR
ncbi:Tat proofreading chaperone DmsD [Acerihabitans arboris]|uniref:Tat proofreading chaperone DmsD n=1 Tax=Acerihabitans arboris TaxID=2691583 RepID=A0A845SF36_9GAMM|nr:Tat proofreading chaperone DmsD [Acerihabitans arboris]NDL61554.1 Tat proofreading chaperone DmsD [Acerihabitans arboris]